MTLSILHMGINSKSRHFPGERCAPQEEAYRQRPAYCLLVFPMVILYQREQRDKDAYCKNSVRMVMSMNSLDLRQDTIETVKHEIVDMVKGGMKDDLDAIVLYGSCARGDYSADSDIDIALLTNCDRMESKKYTDLLAGIATMMALKYFAVINFVCLPKLEFDEKKSWYSYFRNIDREGEVLYG